PLAYGSRLNEDIPKVFLGRTARLRQRKRFGKGGCFQKETSLLQGNIRVKIWKQWRETGVFCSKLQFCHNAKNNKGLRLALPEMDQ
ncbi:MAG TPA: hypothetical protein VMF69_15800, partial [Gemmataceae bacterium]|nr:hypothetical protein [Gemmataceae bacterium]